MAAAWHGRVSHLKPGMEPVTASPPRSGLLTLRLGQECGSGGWRSVQSLDGGDSGCFNFQTAHGTVVSRLDPSSGQRDYYARRVFTSQCFYS